MRLWIEELSNRIKAMFSHQSAWYGAVFILVLLATTLCIIMGYIYRWDWIGVADKKLWDWLSILIVPFVVALAGTIYTHVHNQSEREEARQKEAQEHELALDNQREAALQTYFDRMSELLLDKQLETNSQAMAIAHARTVTVLRMLDPARRASVLRFLGDVNLASRILNRDMRSLDLSGTDLSSAHLKQVMLILVNLIEASLKRADLSEANLEKAWMRSANLGKANLEDTNLWRADLSRARLDEANLRWVNLVEANLYRASLLEADLTGANLWRAQLNKARLDYARLRWANLIETNLSGATLLGVDLTGANLKGANLENANLSEAILVKTQFIDVRGVTSEQMEDFRKRGAYTQIQPGDSQVLDIIKIEASSQTEIEGPQIISTEEHIDEAGSMQQEIK
ncbi:hypothetical protein KSB_55750 [Ktedonobacter robiniae]|uniref:Pentapeptide repeat-containing protein n=1 Tax=Ktedonobacter robiniae TaxID=2778365 RepID=A0ABQ3UXR0_9CHLR|nr:hypothetical protein KSB_55750 [Ktedonobacter robiniae]